MAHLSLKQEDIVRICLAGHMGVRLTAQNLLSVVQKINNMANDERRKASGVSANMLAGLIELNFALALPLNIQVQVDTVNNLFDRHGLKRNDLAVVCYVFKNSMSMKTWNRLMTQIALDTGHPEFQELASFDKDAVKGQVWTITDLAHFDPDLFLRFTIGLNL